MYNIAGHVNMYNIAAVNLSNRETGVRIARAKLSLLVYIAWYMSRSIEKLTRTGEEERLSIPVAKLDENNKK